MNFFYLANETKDIVRYHYDGVVQDSCLEHHRAGHLDAASLTEKIISCLDGLQYKDRHSTTTMLDWWSDVHRIFPPKSGQQWFSPWRSPMDES